MAGDGAPIAVSDAAAARTRDRLRVRRRPRATAVDVGRDEVDLLAVLVRHRLAVGRPRVRPEHHTPAKHTPEMVVPVFIAFLNARPEPRSISLRRTLSKLNPPRSSASSRWMCAIATAGSNPGACWSASQIRALKISSLHEFETAWRRLTAPVRASLAVALCRKRTRSVW